MGLILEGIKEAIRLIFSFDKDVMIITWTSIRVALISTSLAMLAGIPCGMALALKNFLGRKFLISLINTGMAFPPVAIGLWVSIFLWRSGPLGRLQLIYTPSALIIAQFVIAFPMIAGFTVAGIQQLSPKIHLQILSLGATKFQYTLAIIRETKLPIIAAIIAGFGAVISEVGASMMVGGNIKGSTRMLTTATVLEVAKGNFGTAMALTIILMSIAYIVTLLLTLVQQEKRE